MIPLSVPNLSGNEWKYIKECLDTNWVSSVGSYVKLFEEKAAAFCGCKYGVAISNGTSALHISLLLAGVQSNDYVLLPNITFVASANSIKYIGAEPLLIDVDQDDWQMDLDLLEQFLEEETTISASGCIHTQSNRRVSAIMPVHVLGNIGDMDRLLVIANKYALVVVEDATEALGSYYKGKHAGSFGLMGCLSFNGNKIITTGGGGMIVTNDEDIAKRAKHLTTQAKADPMEYYHDEVGYNYRLVNILAAMGVAQMEQLPGFINRKKEIANRYNEAFSNIQEIRPQAYSSDVDANKWLYTIYTGQQKELRSFLWNNDIEVRPFWTPMNQLPAFNGCTYYNADDVSSNVYGHCLSLPCSSSLTDDEQQTTINLVKQFFNA